MSIKQQCFYDINNKQYLKEKYRLQVEHQITRVGT